MMCTVHVRTLSGRNLSFRKLHELVNNDNMSESVGSEEN